MLASPAIGTTADGIVVMKIFCHCVTAYSLRVGSEGVAPERWPLKELFSIFVRKFLDTFLSRQIVYVPA